MPLPKFQQLRPGGPLGRVEDNVAAFARSLADERSGLLAHNLTVSEHFRGKVFRIDVTSPDDWTTVTPGQWVFGSNYQQWTDTLYGRNGLCALRKGPDGWVDCVGMWDNISNTASASDYLISFPAGSPLAPPDGGWAIESSNNFMQQGTVIIRSNGVQWNTGLVSQWVSLAGLRWRAADATPPPWPEPSQPVLSLGEDYPGTPEVVRVEDAVTEAGVHLGPLQVSWELGRVGRSPAVRVRRVEGLAPLTKYRLTLAILVA